MDKFQQWLILLSLRWYHRENALKCICCIMQPSLSIELTSQDRYAFFKSPAIWLLSLINSVWGILDCLSWCCQYLNHYPLAYGVTRAQCAKYLDQFVMCNYRVMDCNDFIASYSLSLPCNMPYRDDDYTWKQVMNIQQNPVAVWVSFRQAVRASYHQIWCRYFEG